MSEAVIVALITGACAIIAQLIISKQSAKDLYTKLDKQSEIADKELDAKLEKHQAVTDVKIDELTREVRAHNNFAQRMPVVEEQIKVINHRIEDLEHKTE
jgi:DNA-binding helix-hairpin-helix protein with protein kinase domain